MNPSYIGGELKLANSVNAWEKLKLHLPKFLQYELLRALPRDVLDNGKGVGNEDGLVSKLSRADYLLSLRIQRNSYPIFVENQNDMRFRYMRYWIESGHRKVGLPISPLLTIAMDFLDQALDRECIFNENLKRGEMMYTNNMLVAHARNAFQDDPTGANPPRFKVRTWIQVNNLKGTC